MVCTIKSSCVAYVGLKEKKMPNRFGEKKFLTI